MAEVTYYFDDYDIVLYYWETLPARMVDGILTNYASTSLNGDIQTVDDHTCPGIDLGTITKVELRCYGYGDGNDRIDISPQFYDVDGSWLGKGDEHQVTMPSSAGWGAYVDITNDTNHPDWASWLHIVKLNAEIKFTKVAKGNTMYCAKVEIRVTYEEAPPAYYHGLKIQGEGELALCDVGSHPLRIRKGGTTYGLELVAVDDPNASRIRIKTGAGIKAIRKYI